MKILYSYGPEPSEEEEKHLISLLNRKFNNNYEFIKDFMPLEKYFDLIKESTCYVCNHDGQTGLGAIYSATRIGREVFVKGSNYLWLRKNGIKAFRIQDLISCYPNIPRLSHEELVHNRERILNFLDPQTIVSQWDKLFAI